MAGNPFYRVFAPAALLLMAPSCGSSPGSPPPAPEVSTAAVPSATPASPADERAGPSHHDGATNLGETDVDCGGSIADANGPAPRCATGKRCLGAADCRDGVCEPSSGTCAPPTSHDGVKNGDESDVDCGGSMTGAPRCPAGKGCAVGDDCVAQGCNDLGRCAAGRSCVRKYGGRTCGPGEDDAQHEDCCTRIASPAGPNGPFAVDKYLVTAGRMRAFLDAVDGKVRDYVSANKPAWWKDEWTIYLPNAWDTTGLPPGEHVNVWSAYAQVGGGIMVDEPGDQGCWIGDGYGHPTFYVPRQPHTKNGRTVGGAEQIYGDTYDRWLSQDQLDVRAMNCASTLMFAAFCAYDGGELMSVAEYDYIYDVDGTGTVSTYPWGERGPGIAEAGGYADVGGIWTLIGPATSPAYASPQPCPACQDDLVSWSYNYESPATPATPIAARDQANLVPPPGRFPKGASRSLDGTARGRVEDIAGLLIETTRTLEGSSSIVMTFGNEDPSDDRTVQMDMATWRGGSWEGHAISRTWNGFRVATKYGKMGARCVYR